MAFQTEKQTEALLELETRELPMPDGSIRSLTTFKLAWDSYDFVLACGVWMPQDITRMAAEDAAELGFAFDEYFPSAVSYMHGRICEEHDKLDGSF